jgi:broad specificity phosphatase PhoE
MSEDRENPAKLPTRFTLISHAATEALRRATFPLDEALEEREMKKIAAIGWNAPRAQYVLSGPERRTQQTAQALGLSAITAVELRDCSYGAWGGSSFEALQAEHPEQILAWLTDPSAVPHGGESIVKLIDRVGRWMEARSDNGHTIAVTHPSVIRSAIVHALKAPAQSFWRIDVAPLSLTDLRFNGRAWTLRSSACQLSSFEEEG